MDPAGLLQRLQGLAQTLVFDESVSRSLARVSTASPGKRASTWSWRLRRFSACRVRRPPPDGPSAASVATSSRYTGGEAGRGTVFAGEHQAFPGAPEVEVRVAEGMQVTGTAEPLTGGDSAGGVLARVMHQHDREVQLPLQRAKVGQQPGHFAGVVLVDAVQPHQRIEKQQPGPQPLGRLQEPRCGADRDRAEASGQ